MQWDNSPYPPAPAAARPFLRREGAMRALTHACFGFIVGMGLTIYYLVGVLDLDTTGAADTVAKFQWTMGMLAVMAFAVLAPAGALVGRWLLRRRWHREHPQVP